MKRSHTKLMITLTLLASTLLPITSHSEETLVPYPDGYRDWTHIKSMVIEPAHPLANPFQGIHHVYGNKKAIKGQKSGKYANGAIIVFDLLHYTQSDNTLQEGDRKLLGVMHKDDKRFSATGGWGFEGFAGNSKSKRLTNDGGASCFACHAPQKKSDYVFSKLRK